MLFVCLFVSIQTFKCIRLKQKQIKQNETNGILNCFYTFLVPEEKTETTPLAHDRPFDFKVYQFCNNFQFIVDGFALIFKRSIHAETIAE